MAKEEFLTLETARPGVNTHYGPILMTRADGHVYPVDYGAFIRASSLTSCPYTLRKSDPYIGWEVTSGCDPELFVLDASGEVIPAWTFLPHRKSAPRSGYAAAYWDGFQAEFRLNAASQCLDYTHTRINDGLFQIVKAKPPGSRVSLLNVVNVPQRLRTEATDEQIALGCEPSLNAYDDKPDVIENPRGLAIRFAGGHIHFGAWPWNAQCYHRESAIREAVKMLDATIGVASVGLFQTDDPRRRRYYGRAGEFRMPEHGLEYRVLSNAWLRAVPVYYMTFTLARMAARLSLYDWRKDLDAPENEVQRCINTCDVDMARDLVRRNRAFWTTLFGMCYNGYKHVAKYRPLFDEMVAKGVHQYFSDDIEENWANEKYSQFGQWASKA